MTAHYWLYLGNLGTKMGGRKQCVPGVGESFSVVNNHERESGNRPFPR